MNSHDMNSHDENSYDVNSYDIMKSYIYHDASAFSTDWNHHVKLLATILCWLCKNGFTINPLKSEWTVRETDWLG